MGEYNGSPCVPARDQFSSGVHCDSASWATLEDPSQIGSCRKVTRAKKPNANVVESADWVGEWGGTCTCPDGTQYSVGDVLWDCGALACYGGQMGQCHKMSGPWSKKKVKCDNNHINSHYDRSGKKVCWKDNCKYTKNQNGTLIQTTNLVKCNAAGKASVHAANPGIPQRIGIA